MNDLVKDISNPVGRALELKAEQQILRSMSHHATMMIMHFRDTDTNEVLRHSLMVYQEAAWGRIDEISGILERYQNEYKSVFLEQ